MPTQIYRKLKERCFFAKVVAEIGVWHPDTSNVADFINDGIDTLLVEPDPESIKLIKSRHGNKEHVTLVEAAVCDFAGDVELCTRGASTFVATLPNSPALTNDHVDKTETKSSPPKPSNSAPSTMATLTSSPWTLKAVSGL